MDSSGSHTSESPVSENLALRRSSRASLSGKKHLLYDQKFHPIDLVNRPAHTARRRKLHGISSNHKIEDSETEEDSDDTDTDYSDGEYKPRGGTLSRSSAQHARHERTAGSFRPARIRSSTPPIYDSGIHPQDEWLEAAGVEIPPRKRRKTTLVFEGQVGEVPETLSETEPVVVSFVEEDENQLDHGYETSYPLEIDYDDNAAHPMSLSTQSLASPNQPEVQDHGCPSLNPHPRSIEQIAERYQNAWLSQSLPAKQPLQVDLPNNLQPEFQDETQDDTISNLELQDQGMSDEQPRHETMLESIFAIVRDLDTSVNHGLNDQTSLPGLADSNPLSCLQNSFENNLVQSESIFHMKPGPSSNAVMPESIPIFIHPNRTLNNVDNDQVPYGYGRLGSPDPTFPLS